MIRIVPAIVLAIAPPVPVQRPSTMPGPEPESKAEPESEPEPEPEPESESESDSDSDSDSDSVSESDSDSDSDSVSDSAPGTTGTATIHGALVDTEIANAPLVRTQVEAVCTCLDEPRVTFTDAHGRFEFEALPAGVYTIVATRGGRPTHEVVAIADGDEATVDIRVGPPTTTATIDERDAVRQRANTMIAIGGVSGIGALAMLLAAAVEQRKPDCKFGQSECADAPRPTAMIGLGVAGGILAVASAALIGVGVHRIRKLNARIAVDDRSAALTISGRF